MISKHLQECMEIIKRLKKTSFQPIDVYPKIRRGEWVFKKLVDANYLIKFFVAEEAFYKINNNESTNRMRGKSGSLQGL
jgi:hypothetical protein